MGNSVSTPFSSKKNNGTLLDLNLHSVLAPGEQDWDLRVLGAHFGSSRSSLWVPGAHSGAPTLATWLHGEADGSPWYPLWDDFESHFASSRVMGNMLATKLRTFAKHHYTCMDCMSEDGTEDCRGPLHD